MTQNATQGTKAMLKAIISTIKEISRRHTTENRKTQFQSVCPVKIVKI